MTNVLLRQPDGKQQCIQLMPDQTLLRALQQAGQTLSAPCGGTGRCGKCAILATAGAWPPTTADEYHLTRQQLQEGWRLACHITDKTIAAGGADPQQVILQVPRLTESGESTGLMVASEFPEPGEPEWMKKPSMAFSPLKSASSHLETGIAIDLGTTTLGFRLVDRQNGAIMREDSRMNRQQQYGADVVTRIQQASQGHLKAMAALIQEDLMQGMASLTRGLSEIFITAITIAGNTTMLHLLQEISPAGMGQHPFTPVTLDMVTIPFQRLFSSSDPSKAHSLPLSPHCPVTLLPGLDAFLGADITAGIYHTRLHESEEISLLVDIGTNGEMVVGNRHGFTATATAAGPAFEGGSLSCGMAGVSGAIHALTWETDTFHLKTIDDQPPMGICGSGVVDLVAEGLRHGWIDVTGRLVSRFQGNAVTLKAPSGTPPIQVTQKDIREVQLATAAIRAGIHCLLETAAIPMEAVQRVYLAGGFGSRLNLSSALTMGLLPSPLAGKVIVAGNTALAGAADLLTDPEAPEKLQHIRQLATTLNLSNSPCFQQAFMKAMTFPQCATIHR
ncbi:ASKHA domain-containing protein [Anoxynatronum sibiricum]|uniref:ASKHA domain-containing protein n=1 Tax=Anoxynatronum sibiricum TaxID=210623 RepID=A0ABU9VW04_9CLOT